MYFFPVIVDVVSPRAPHLANFIAARKNLPPVAIPTEAVEVVPACAVPFNAALHDLPFEGDLVVKDKACIQDFKSNLELSRYFAADFHGAADASGTDEFGFVTLCLRKKIFHLAPRIYPDTVEPIMEILRTTPRPVFVYRWYHYQRDVLRQFGWAPADVIEVQDVAREIGIPPTIDAIVEKTVGGKFCRRGANFADVSLPSEEARRHCNIRASLYYEFVARFRRLREGRGRREQQPDRGVDRRRSSRDREALAPDERRHRHGGSRGHDRDRSHRR